MWFREKAQNKELMPNLDTSPDVLPAGRN